jgi:methylenetetrahydrofolate dehydrogenase (NADP+)/methenyltetrahydrofolate cyclohydrolase
LTSYSSKADILISAAGVPDLIRSEHVKDDFFVIDVGIVKTDRGIQGDVDVASVSEKSGILTPVPGGVGPITVACSLKNMVYTINHTTKNQS